MAENFTSFDELEKHFAQEDAFDPNEIIQIVKITGIDMVPMPERMMEARGIDFASEDFKAQFNSGIPCIRIATEGVDVEYDFGEGNKRDIIIEVVNFQGEKVGQPKGEGSKLHVTDQAFQDVFGFGLFGTESRKQLVGQIARWGQHFGSAKMDGETRRWRWDVPREALGKDFVYTGEVRKIQGRAQKDGNAASSASAGTALLSEDEAVVVILEKAVGKPVDQADEITADVLSIDGLPTKWSTSAMNDELLKNLFEEDLIDSEGGQIVATDKGKQLAAV